MASVPRLGGKARSRATASSLAAELVLGHKDAQVEHFVVHPIVPHTPTFAQDLVVLDPHVPPWAGAFQAEDIKLEATVLGYDT